MSRNEELTKDIIKIGKHIVKAHDPRVVEASQKLTVVLEASKEI